MLSQIRVLSFEFRAWCKNMRHCERSEAIQFLQNIVTSGLPRRLRLLAMTKTTLHTPYSILILLFLAGCGFQPVYGTASGASEKSPIRAGVKISASASGAATTTTNSVVDNNATANMARQFTNNLEDMLNYEGTPTYKLDVALTQSVVGIGVARDGTASRYNLILNSTYKLIRITDGKEVDSGTLSNFTSYNNPNNQYFSTYVSEQDARKRGIKELAELYRQRLISFTEKTIPAITPPLNSNENIIKSN